MSTNLLIATNRLPLLPIQQLIDSALKTCQQFDANAFGATVSFEIMGSKSESQLISQETQFSSTLPEESYVWIKTSYSDGGIDICIEKADQDSKEYISDQVFRHATHRLTVIDFKSDVFIIYIRKSSFEYDALKKYFLTLSVVINYFSQGILYSIDPFKYSHLLPIAYSDFASPDMACHELFANESV